MTTTPAVLTAGEEDVGSQAGPVKTPVWLWAVLVSPIPPCWYAVVASGNGVDDRAFLWVGIGAALPVTLYATNRLVERITREMQRKWLLPSRKEF